MTYTLKLNTNQGNLLQLSFNADGTLTVEHTDIQGFPLQYNEACEINNFQEISQTFSDFSKFMSERVDYE